MRCPSLYNFYRVYFGMPSSGMLQFALAIRDSQRLLAETFQDGSFEKVDDYVREPVRAKGIAKIFLNNFRSLALHHYDDCFQSLDYESNLITIDKEMLGGRRRLDIPFTYAFEATSGTALFFEYGKLGEVHHWQTVFQTLTNGYRLQSAMPQFRRILYWDLLKGTTRVLDPDEIVAATMEKVTAAARRYILSNGKF